MGDITDVTDNTGTDTGSSTAGNGDSSGKPDGRTGDGTGTGVATGSGAGIDTTEQVQPTGTETGQVAGGRPGRTGTDDPRGKPGNGDGNSAEQPAKRKPGRPRGSRNKSTTGQSTTGKQASGTVRATVGADKSTAPKRTPRRTKKITGKQVEDGVQKLFGLVSMFRGQHWKVDAAEVESWSNEAAELLNKIPSETYERFMNASTIGTVAIGIGGIVVPRAMVDMQAVKIKRMAAELARQEQEQKDAAEGVETVDATPSPREPETATSTPRGMFNGVPEGFV